MLTFNKLTFNIGQKNFFDNLNITFLPSSITYIQGENGSGKSSLLKMIADIMQPSYGSIYYGDMPVNIYHKPYCNYIGHNFAVKAEMTVFDNLKFWSEIYNSLETLEVGIRYFKLYELLDEKCYKLSKGMQKIIALTRLIACQSNLWLLDEVEANLSEENTKLLNNLIIMKANSGGIIFIASHNSPTIKSAGILKLEEYRTFFSK